MEIKSFLIEEHAETIFDNEKIAEWKNLVAELGLENQAALLKGNTVGSPLPFPAMTEAERTIYSLVLETKCNYKNFTSEAIPLKMLSLISLCEREKYFDKIEIWYSRNNPDPMIVGKNFENENDKKNNYEWLMVPFLIGAWGAKIKDVSELLPAWDNLQFEELKNDYDYKIKEHQKIVEKFKFQLNAIQIT